ncbi:hypothetical protein RR42_m3733 [Cupriavidus basilensis]|uniref:Uncharacterized protein n=1 Tax=Cupriavidus basilensis TaxID=68895 RepID=A0A0C4YE60_9BURK|nr:hypothetical protein RR42_m3733 [Cupriavidus basilensis]
MGRMGRVGPGGPRAWMDRISGASQRVGALRYAGSGHEQGFRVVDRARLARRCAADVTCMGLPLLVTLCMAV